MALDPIVSGTLNQMLGGNSFVEQRDFKPSMWDHTSIPGMLGEVPMRMNWETGKMEPVDGPGGPVHGDMRGKDWGGNPVGGAVHGDIAGIFNPLNPFKWGEVPEIREQVQKGTYAPKEDVVSPTDQFLRGVSGRNRKLQEIMDQAGW